MRVPISPGIAAEVLFRHSHTCCVCNVRGKAVQIHHIDENPSHNSIDNLAVLCLECHNNTMIDGGFGRKLNAMVVVRYRDEWVRRVAEIKNSADQIMIKQLSVASDSSQARFSSKRGERGSLQLLVLIDSIPDTLKKARRFAQRQWDTGITGEVNDATLQVIEIVKAMWVGVAKFYNENHWGKPPEIFAEEYAASRFELHSKIAEFDLGYVGTMTSITVAHSALLDMQELLKMTADSVLISRADSSVSPIRWRQRFDDAVAPPTGAVDAEADDSGNSSDFLSMSEAEQSGRTDQPEIYRSPDKALHAVISPVGMTLHGGSAAESHVMIRRADATLLTSKDHSSQDGMHGHCVVRAGWSPDSQFFVYSLSSSGGHSPWSFPIWVYSRRRNLFASFNDMIDNPTVSGDFTFNGAHIIRAATWETSGSDKHMQIVVDLEQAISRIAAASES